MSTSFMKRECYLRKGLLSLLLLITAAGNSSACGSLNRPVHFVLPDGYVGLIKIILDESNGIEVQKKDGRYTYEIPSDGILRLKRFEPMREMHVETASYKDGKEIVTSISVSDDTVAFRDIGSHTVGNGPETIVIVIGTKKQEMYIREQMGTPEFEQTLPQVYNERLKQLR